MVSGGTAAPRFPEEAAVESWSNALAETDESKSAKLRSSWDSAQLWRPQRRVHVCSRVSWTWFYTRVSVSEV